MKPTKEQLADPKWWDDNSNGFDYIFYLERNDEYLFADDNGEGGNFKLIVGGAGWKLLAKRPEPEWVPVLGSVCEIAASTEYLKISHKEGLKVKIYSRFIDDRGVTLFAFVAIDGKSGGVVTAECLRPIKTQREEFIEEAKYRIKNMDADDIILAGKLYDAGCHFDLTEKDGE